MRKLTKIAVGAIMAAAGTAAVAVPASAQTAAPAASAQPSATVRAATVKPAGVPIAPGTIRNCPKGYGCLFTSSGWTAAVPEDEWEAAGCHDLYDEYGWREAVNNQTDGWTMSLYKSGSCSGSPSLTLKPGQDRSVNITPINAVYLSP